ncbi:MAG: hypothetical protein M0Z85_03630 [Gammaproteobacteria bacterium]|nr:hypothetical protein [Gammaproteobacteria bacterium]
MVAETQMNLADIPNDVPLGEAEVPRDMVNCGNVTGNKPPWWVAVVIAVGLGEAAWFAKTVMYGSEQSAVTATEIHQLQQGQSALTSSLTTLDTDVQTLNVNVAVLTQQIKDDRWQKNVQ